MSLYRNMFPTLLEVVDQLRIKAVMHDQGALSGVGGYLAREDFDTCGEASMVGIPRLVLVQGLRDLDAMARWELFADLPGEGAMKRIGDLVRICGGGGDRVEALQKVLRYKVTGDVQAWPPEVQSGPLCAEIHNALITSLAQELSDLAAHLDREEVANLLSAAHDARI